MVVGKLISVIISVLIAGALLTTAGLTSYFSAANYTGISAVIMPFVPLLVGLIVVVYVGKEAGFDF